MTQTATLTGFVIHSRPYQEKRAIYSFFCRDYGLIDGIGGRGLPPFVPIQLVMGGRGSLKNFKDPFVLTDTPNALTNRLPLNLQYTALYLNELLYKLLPKDDPQEELWQVYYQTLALFEIGCDRLALRSVLRRFEWALFVALGLPILLDIDSNNEPINNCGYYLYQNELGFVPIIVAALPPSQQAKVLLGADILAMNELCKYLGQGLADIDFDIINKDRLLAMGQLFRQIIDELLEFKPLHSRQLWLDLQKLSH